MKNKLTQLKNSKLFNIPIVVLFCFSIFLLINSGKNDNYEWSKWNTYNVRNTAIFTTDDWFNYNRQNIFGEFLISFPADWKINENVFINKDGQKTGEFSPGLVQLKPDRSCFDVEWYNESGESELLSQENIRIGSFKGKLLIEKAHVQNESANNEYLYPYFYCLSNGDKAFVITFYEWKLELSNKDLHNKILETLSL